MKVMSDDGRTPASMKAVWFVEPKTARLLNEPVPELAPGRLLCRTIYSGITNGTERNLLLGGCYCPGWPCRIGYQNVGRVIAVGSGLRGIEPGQVVFSGELAGHAQFFLADPGHLTLKLPEDVDLRHGALLGLFSIALHALRRAEVNVSDRILVIGVGPIGQFVVHEAAVLGADVTAMDRDQERLRIAHENGARRLVRITHEPAWKSKVAKCGPYSVCIDCSGSESLRILAGATVFRQGARVVLLGGRTEVSYPFLPAQQAELTVLHTRHFDRNDLCAALERLVNGFLPIADIVSHIVPISEAAGLYRQLIEKPQTIMGAVLDWRSCGSSGERDDG